jgi:ribonuclease P protein component
MSDEAHLSTEQSGSRTAARVPGPHGDGRRTCGDSRTSCARSQEAQRLITISKRSDFLAANASTRLATPGFVLLIRNRDDGAAVKRLGITVTKKIGGAVVRNRMKRRFRALAQDVIARNGFDGSDHILIGRAGGVERNFDLLRAELHKALKRARG